jgi:hypothetical protein
MIFYCVEEAHANIGQNYYDWNFKMTNTLPHHIAFPHVDSCLAVICNLTVGNRIFACHINGYHNLNNFPNIPAAHIGAWNRLLACLAPDTVSHAMIFGDVANWQAMGVVNPPPWLNCNIYMPNNQAHGVDVLFEVDTGSFRIMSYVQNRNFRAIPANHILAGGPVNLNGVAGQNTIII